MTEYDESDFAKVPSDFPRTTLSGAVPGSQPKVLVTRYREAFYPSGCTPPERYERWKACEEIAQELAFEANRDKTDRITNRTEVEMLQKYFEILCRSWMSLDEAKWIVRRMGEILGWPVPTSVSE
jgi:hypothetical protein